MYLVLLAQMVASFGLAPGPAAGALLAEEITDSPVTAGAPFGALVIGAGLSAPLITRIMRRRGRPAGLRCGYLAAMAGAVVVVVAASNASLPLLLVGNLVMGAGNSAVMLSRYAVADVGPGRARVRSIGTSLVAVAAGTVSGTLLGSRSAAGRRASVLRPLHEGRRGRVPELRAPPKD